MYELSLLSFRLTRVSFRILAFDKDASRVKILKQMLSKAGAERYTRTFHRDFLSTDVTDDVFASVKYAIVDPSCSGSGELKATWIIFNVYLRYTANVSQAIWKI